MLIEARYTSDATKQKLRELILYIADRLESDVHFGMTKLNKVILFVDVLAYLRYGTPVTGTQYMKLPHGPVPVHMKQIIEEMQEADDIAIREQQKLQYIQKRVIPLRNANLDDFTARDIALVEEVIDDCTDFNAKWISLLSHGTAWKVAGEKEIIPYTAFFLSDRQQLTEEDIEEGQSLIKQHGWEVYAKT